MSHAACYLQYFIVVSSNGHQNKTGNIISVAKQSCNN